MRKLAVRIDDTIYEICDRSVKRVTRNIVIPESTARFNSKNFQAIADANLKRYTRCVEDEVDEEQTLRYLLVWQENKSYAEVSDA